MKSLFRVALTISVLFFGISSFAASSGGWSLGANLGFINADQDDMNTLITRANTRESGITTSQLGNAYELTGYIGYRFASSFVEFQFRPSYFFQSEEGTGGGNSYEYGVNAFTLFPTFRFYMLEDKTMAFYSHVGIGWGFASGEIKEGVDSVDFSGSSMGYMAGLGAMFCFFSDSHCVTVEGSYRFLDIDRVEADSSSGDFTDNSPSPASLSQASKGQEVEVDGRDLGVSLSGILGAIGYVFRF